MLHFRIDLCLDIFRMWDLLENRAVVSLKEMKQEWQVLKVGWIQ